MIDCLNRVVKPMLPTDMETRMMERHVNFFVNLHAFTSRLVL